MLSDDINFLVNEKKYRRSDVMLGTALFFNLLPERTEFAGMPSDKMIGFIPCSANYVNAGDCYQNPYDPEYYFKILDVSLLQERALATLLHVSEQV